MRMRVRKWAGEGKEKYVWGEGSATAEKSVRDFEFTERFQDFSKDFRFQPIQQKISDFSEDFKISVKISDFSEDFKISPKISDFARISAEISRFHVISGEISRFQQRFHGSQRTAYSQGTLRGAGASATECDTASARVCMREYAGTSLCSTVSRLYTGMCCWTGYIGAVRGAVTAVVSQGSRIFPALVSRYRKLPRGTDFTGILQRRQDQYIHERILI